MKIDIKKDKTLKVMAEGGKRLSAVLDELVHFTKVGTNFLEIEEKAYRDLKKSGGIPGFTTVEDYRWATCLNVNDGIVHGIPKDYTIKDSDLVSIDIGLLYEGWHTDMSFSFQVGTQTPRVQRFLQAGKESLNNAFKQVRTGKRVGNISEAMDSTLRKYGYQGMPELTGHGIGRELHEYPPIPCVPWQPIKQTPMLKKNMTIAIEVIYVEGDTDYYTSKEDGWTIMAADGKMAAVFEKTIAVTDDGYFLLTP